MQGDIEITSYNLTMVLQAQGESSQLSGAAEEILRNPLSVEKDSEDQMFASAHDQLTLTFQPPRATPSQPPRANLTDVSGAWPIRPAFANGLSNLVTFLLRQSVSVSAYGWNMQGVLRDVDLVGVVGGLFDQSRIDRILGGDTEPQWFVPEIEFVSDSTFSDGLIFSLRQDAQPDDDPDALQFTMTSHFEREFVDGVNLEEQGQEFTRNAEGILTRLVD